jgi:hypothetical protein
MKVEKMISLKEAQGKKENNLQGDYYISLLIYLKENNLKFTGDMHQAEDFNGVPLFEDGTVSICSWRYWGGIMSQLWGGDYMDWYMEAYRPENRE